MIVGIIIALIVALKRGEDGSKAVSVAVVGTFLIVSLVAAHDIPMSYKTYDMDSMRVGTGRFYTEAGVLNEYPATLYIKDGKYYIKDASEIARNPFGAYELKEVWLIGANNGDCNCSKAQNGTGANNNYHFDNCPNLQNSVQNNECNHHETKVQNNTQ